MKRVLVGMCLSVILVLTVTAKEPKEAPKTEVTKPAATEVKKDTTAAKETPWNTNPSGLKWRDKVVGKGTEAKMNMPVKCHYTVWLTDSTGTKGKLIQSSKEGNPLHCTIGVQLIQGWSEGMIGMKEGGTRELIVPPAIGYGSRARGTLIPANSTLYFEIDFLNEVKQ